MGEGMYQLWLAGEPDDWDDWDEWILHIIFSNQAPKLEDIKTKTVININENWSLAA